MAAPSVSHHNAVLRKGEERALALEEKLAAIVEPILLEAGDIAASQFRALAVDHLAASARMRARDHARMKVMGMTEARRVYRSLGLTAAMDVQANSTMVCVKPREAEAEALAAPDGSPPENLHVTLCYLGELDGPLAPIADALRPVAAALAPLTGQVGGYGQFGMPDGSSVGILLPDVPGLVELRCAVAEALCDAGIEYAREHGFEAHLTVNPDPEPGELEKMLPLSGSPLHFDALYVVRGDTEIVPIPLVGMPAMTAAAGERYCLPARLRTKTDPVRQEVVKTMMKASLEGVGLSFDVTNPLAARVLAQSASQITHIALTTQLDVMRVISAAHEEGLSIDATAEAIREKMRDASPARARLIARTELVGAVNGGSLAATQIVANATGQAFFKQWMTASGAKHPRHNAYPGLGGQTRKLDDYFQVGRYSLEYPGDPSGPPEEICNCRCTLGYTDNPAALAMFASADVPDTPSVEDELAAAVATLTAAGPAEWSAPDPDQILNVNCTGEAQAAKTAQIALNDLRDNDYRYRIDVVDAGEIDEDFETEVFGWPGEAEDVAGAAITEASAGVGDLWTLFDAADGTLSAVANVERGTDSLIVRNIGSGGKGAGTTLLQMIAQRAAIEGKGIRLKATPDAAPYYRRLPGFMEGDDLTFFLPPSKANGFSQGHVPES